MSFCTICNAATAVECGGCYRRLEAERDALRARVERLEAVLAPLANYPDKPDMGADVAVASFHTRTAHALITLGDVRRARAALEKEP